MIDTFLNVGKLQQEVQRMVKNLFFIGFLLLLFFLVILMMLTAGWLRIIVDGSEVIKDIRNVGNGIISKEDIQQKPENRNWDNQMFSVKSHKVKPGETLLDLENQYGTNWKVIKRVNKIENPFRLKTGAILQVPVRIADS